VRVFRIGCAGEVAEFSLRQICPAHEFDFMAKTDHHRKVLEMRMTPSEVGRAVALYIAARCGKKIEGEIEITTHYYFDKVDSDFIGMDARVVIK